MLEGSSERSVLRVSAMLGAACWLVHRFAADANLISSTLVMGILVVVPLGLSLSRGVSPSTLSLLSIFQPAAAVGAVVSLTLEPSAAAGMFAVPWLGFTLLLAILGVRLLKDSTPALSRAQAMGWILIAFGGLWLVMSRAGLDPMQQGTLRMLLMAVHFHFPAFGGLVLLSNCHEQLAQAAAPGAAPVLSRASAAAYCLAAGVVLAAAGSLGLPLLGVAGALLLSFVLFAWAFVCWRYLLKYQSGWLPKGLLLVSTLSVFVSMPLACLWAVSKLTGSSLIDFASMLRLHGMANAHGVILCGLLACAWQTKSSQAGRPKAELAPSDLETTPPGLSAGAE